MEPMHVAGRVAGTLVVLLLLAVPALADTPYEKQLRTLLVEGTGRQIGRIAACDAAKAAILNVEEVTFMSLIVANDMTGMPHSAIATEIDRLSHVMTEYASIEAKQFSKSICPDILASYYDTLERTRRNIETFKPQRRKGYPKAIQELVAQRFGKEYTPPQQAVQEALRQAGYNPGSIDDKGGPQTVAALRKFQAAKGLPVTGEADAATRKALGLP